MKRIDKMTRLMWNMQQRNAISLASSSSSLKPSSYFPPLGSVYVSSMKPQSFRFYTDNQSRPRNFLSNLMKNINEEFAKNKELQENRRQLDERLKSLNDSEALREARKKFDLIEKETLKSSQLIQSKLNEMRDMVSKMVTEIQKTDAGKKLSAAAEEVLKQTRAAAEMIEKAAEQIGDNQIYQNVSSSVKIIKDEVDSIVDVRMYSRPEQLKMRSVAYMNSAFADRVVEVDSTSTGIELHKESKWYAGWKSFSENNHETFLEMLNWKMRFDESDSLAVRMVRGFTDKVASLIGGQSEVSEVIAEIQKIDPNFNKIEWLRFCEKEVIPNVLEAFIRGDLNVLKDWCHERAYNVLAAIVDEYKKINFSTNDCRIIDIDKVEMATGKMLEQGPVLIITFQVYMINVVRNMEGKVVEGDPNSPVRVHHVWVMCRDMEEYNPSAAWKVLEVHMQKGNLSF